MLESTLLYWVTGIFFFIALFVLISYTVGFEKLGLDKLMPIVIIESQEAWVVDRLGKDRVLNEGINRIIPGLDRVEAKVSLKEQPIDPPEQEIVTKDNISVKVNMIAMVRVVEPLKAIMEVSDFKGAVNSLIMTSVVDIMGQKELKEIQTRLVDISKDVKKRIEDDSLRWGIQVTQVRFESVTYSPEIQKSMEQKTIAQNKKDAMITEADAKKEAAQREAEALLHKIETLKKSMPNMNDEKILDFMKSLDYINSMNNLSSSSNAKFVIYPSDVQQSIEKAMGVEYLSHAMSHKS